MSEVKVLAVDAFLAVVAEHPDEWRFWSEIILKDLRPVSTMPTTEQATDWLFLPGGQNRSPFWRMHRSQSWVTWDGPADVGYMEETKDWRVEKGEVEWSGRRLEYVGHIERRGGRPAFEVYRPIASS